MMTMLDLMRDMLAKQKSCPHTAVTHVLGRRGPWRAACNACGHVRILTAEECATLDDEIRNSALSPKPRPDL